MTQYPEVISKVTVTFVDGEVKTYLINASPTIAQYLANEARSTGFMTLRNGSTKSWCIPVERIRDIEIAVDEGAVN